jgi:uncharacterized membrane protein YdjX (TVP38/TMEM64 family)
MNDSTTAPKSNLLKWIIAGGGLIALVVAYKFLPIQEWVIGFQEWVKGYGPLGWLIFIVVYAVTTFMLVPGSILTLAAGAVWGFVGFPVVIIGATLGSAISFLAARHLFHDKVQEKVADYPKFKAVNDAIGEEGWKVVGLLRLSPALPFSLQNWFLGITPVGFLPAQIATFFGIMPGTMLYVLLGSAGGKAGSGDMSTAKWVVLGVGILATLIVTVVVTKKAKAKMAEFDQEA